ncbi:MAG: hypothetical protein ABSF26_08750 [Thermoguttaceae bacterium]
MAVKRRKLTIERLQAEALTFSTIESTHAEPLLFGVTDGKAVGTYLEHKFLDYLRVKYTFGAGSSAKGIDIPDLDVDLKVTSIKQPQSSCPYKSARQKIFGLGYNLLVFVYEKTDDAATKTARLNIQHTIFVNKRCTADFQMTTGLRSIIENHGNEDDLVAFMQDRALPVDEIEARAIAQQVLKTPPQVGYLTISNALQWRLQYGRVIEQAGAIDGIVRVR